MSTPSRISEAIQIGLNRSGKFSLVNPLNRYSHGSCFTGETIQGRGYTRSPTAPRRGLRARDEVPGLLELEDAPGASPALGRVARRNLGLRTRSPEPRVRGLRH